MLIADRQKFGVVYCLKDLVRRDHHGDSQIHTTLSVGNDSGGIYLGLFYIPMAVD